MVHRARTFFVIGLLCVSATLVGACAVGSAGSTTSPSPTPTAIAPSSTPTPTPFTYPTEPPMERVGTAELGTQRAKWNAASVTAYRYVLRLGCFCGPETVQPFTVTVRDGKTESIVDEVGRAVDSSHPTYEFLSPLTTVEGLFTRAEANSASQYHSVVVEFDAARGFPTKIRTNPATFIADDELTISITGLEVLPATTPVVMPKSGGPR